VVELQQPHDLPYPQATTFIIGFSLAGDTIPACTGVLVVLEMKDPRNICLTNLVISNSSGNAIDASIKNCLTINS